MNKDKWMNQQGGNIRWSIMISVMIHLIYKNNWFSQRLVCNTHKIDIITLLLGNRAINFLLDGDMV